MSGPVVGFQASMPSASQPFLREAPDGEVMSLISSPWFRLLQSLFERTGGGDGTPQYLAGSFDSAGTTQSTALALRTILSFIRVVGGGVMLPALQGGEFAIVVNKTPSAALNVYPPIIAPSNGQIDGLGLGVPYVMNPGGAIALPTTQIFHVESSMQYYSTQLG